MKDREYSEDLIVQINRMRACNTPISAISRRTGVPERDVMDILQDYAKQHTGYAERFAINATPEAGYGRSRAER